MFAFFNRSRRHVAVLAALAMLASVLVAAPAVAADDPPEPDYTATFDACAGSPSSGYTDVPSGHANAGDIDCIAYYGVTKGTSATTYSPLMSVSREHMALFLIRLAGLVGIEMTSTPDDPGYTDVGDLSEKSQTAIAQLADLDITRGTSDTTFSPGDSVRRDHMALFIARLMDKMDPMESGSDTYGYTPEDVVEVKAVEDDTDTADMDETVKAKMIGSPYSDLGSATKSAYDAITALYELGVLSGISDTSYGPSTLITRASMAEFMAGVLDHSNARPAGISMQAVKGSDFGAVDTDIVISYREDNFAPTVDVELSYFYTGATVDSDDEVAGNQDVLSAGALNKDGNCVAADNADEGTCTGQLNDFTDNDGNFVIGGRAAEGSKNTYYAWMPADDDETFGPDAVQGSVTLDSANDAESFTATSDTAKNADGITVDMDVTGSVTFTIQLRDGLVVDDADNGDVAKSGVEFKVAYRRYVDESDPANHTIDDVTDDLTSISTTTVTTDDSGQATYTVSAPDSDSEKEEASVLDQITFSTDAAGIETLTPSVIVWRDEAPGAPNKAVVAVDKPDYAITYSSDGALVADITSTVTLYDMYGNTAGRTWLVDATIGTGDGSTLENVHVTRRGQARLNRSKVPASQATDNVLSVVVTSIDSADGAEIVADDIDDDDNDVNLVSKATGRSTGDDVMVEDVYADEDAFRASDDNLYSYDSDDTFINEDGEIIDMATFEDDAKGSLIDVLVYDDDGSVFRLKAAA